MATSFDPNSSFTIENIQSLSSNKMGLDIGPKTILDIEQIINKCKIIFWNGPLGVFEWENFSYGTFSIAKAIANHTFNHEDVISIIGGGDSVAAINKADVAHKITHVSTGGGASMEMVQGKQLPAVAVLNKV